MGESNGLFDELVIVGIVLQSMSNEYGLRRRAERKNLLVCLVVPGKDHSVCDQSRLHMP